MPDAPAETATTDAPPTEPPADETATDPSAEIEKWKALARKNEERAKANAGAAKELEKLRETMMSDQERAIAEARAAGRAETLAEVSAELVAASITATAAGRLGPEQISKLVANVNPLNFLGDDGRVSAELVAEFVDGIAPTPNEPAAPAPLDLGQGTRGAPPALNSSELENSLRKAVGA